MDFDALQARLDRPLELLGRGRHENFVVLIPLVELAGRDCLLFQKRAAGIRQAGEICFPGGAREPVSDATLEDAVLREKAPEIHHVRLEQHSFEIGPDGRRRELLPMLYNY